MVRNRRKQERNQSGGTGPHIPGRARGTARGEAEACCGTGKRYDNGKREGTHKGQGRPSQGYQVAVGVLGIPGSQGAATPVGNHTNLRSAGMGMSLTK